MRKIERAAGAPASRFSNGLVAMTLSIIMVAAAGINDRAYAAVDVDRAAEPAAPNANIALLKRVWAPLERGESQDFGAVFNLFADDVVFKTAQGEVRGKAAVIRYFASTAAMLDANPFVKPLEYYGEGDRVVQLGYETFTVKETGTKKECEWAFVYDIHDGRITRMVNIQDLSGVEEFAARALAEARAVERSTKAAAPRP